MTRTASSSQRHKVPPLLAFATGTPDKSFQFGACCTAVTQEELQEKSAAEVQLLSEKLRAFPHAEEDQGSGIKNLMQKNESLEVTAAYIIEDPKAHAVFTDNGTRHAYMIAEDGSVVIEQNIWRVMRAILKEMGVGDDLLNRADECGNKGGPDAEVGPILATVGPRNFVRALVKAAKECGIEDPNKIQIYNFSRISVIDLNASKEAPIKYFEGKTRLFLNPAFFVNDPFRQIPNPEENEIDTTDTYWIPEGEEKPLTDDATFKRYITAVGPRPKALKDALAWIKTNEEKLEATSHPCLSIEGAREDKKEKPKHTTIIDKKWIERRIKTAQGLEKENLPLNKLLDKALSLHDLLANTDALVFAPLDTMSPLEKTFTRYVFFSALVANAVIPDEQTQLIVQDNGSWASTLKLKTHIVNEGFAKDSLIRNAYTGMIAPVALPESVASTSLMHAITHTRKSLLQKTARELLDYHLPRTPQKENILQNISQTEEVFGFLPKVLPFMSAVYTSASTFNHKDLRMAALLGEALAFMDTGIVTGGGLNQSMGEVVRHYNLIAKELCSRGLCANISTHTLVYAENPTGRLPDGTFGALFNYIYGRMGLMASLPNNFNFLQGGFGTIQEVLHEKLAKALFPELMGHKTELFHCPSRLHHEKALYESYFEMEEMGDALQLLEDNKPTALFKEKGLIVCRTSEQVIAAQKVIFENWERNGRPAPSTRPLLLPNGQLYAPQRACAA